MASVGGRRDRCTPGVTKGERGGGGLTDDGARALGVGLPMPEDGDDIMVNSSQLVRTTEGN